jgi:hypothetical protein
MTGMKMNVLIMAVLSSAIIASCSALPVKEYNLAGDLRSKVQKYDLSVYAPDEFQKSEKLYGEGTNNYKKDNGKSKTSLDAAITNYQLVISKGFPAKFSGEAIEAESNKNEALNLKADKYMQKDFADADALYQQASLEMTNKNYENALDKIESAKAEFLKLYQKVKEKKDNSAALIQQVQQKLNDVDKAAQSIKDEKSKSDKIINSLQSDTNSNK